MPGNQVTPLTDHRVRLRTFYGNSLVTIIWSTYRERTMVRCNVGLLISDSKLLTMQESEISKSLVVFTSLEHGGDTKRGEFCYD